MRSPEKVLKLTNKKNELVLDRFENVAFPPRTSVMTALLILHSYKFVIWTLDRFHPALFTSHWLQAFILN